MNLKSNFVNWKERTGNGGIIHVNCPIGIDYRYFNQYGEILVSPNYYKSVVGMSKSKKDRKISAFKIWTLFYAREI